MEDIMSGSFLIFIALIAIYIRLGKRFDNLSKKIAAHTCCCKNV